MPSEFAEKIVGELRAFEGDRLRSSLAMTSIDLSTSIIRNALLHAIHRNHDHSPKSCSACERIEEAAERLKVK